MHIWIIEIKELVGEGEEKRRPHKLLKENVKMRHMAPLWCRNRKKQGHTEIRSIGHWKQRLHDERIM